MFWTGNLEIQGEDPRGNTKINIFVFWRSHHGEPWVDLQNWVLSLAYDVTALHCLCFTHWWDEGLWSPYRSAAPGTIVCSALPSWQTRSGIFSNLKAHNPISLFRLIIKHIPSRRFVPFFMRNLLLDIFTEDINLFFALEQGLIIQPRLVWNFKIFCRSLPNAEPPPPSTLNIN